MRFKLKVCFYAIILLFILFQTALFAKNVAVLDLKNNSGDKSLSFLSYSLAESISNILAQDKELKVVERSQLKKIVDEYSLQQSGLVDTKTIRQIKLLKTDYLIIGSYEGTKEITVVLRIVDIQSGLVITSGKVAGTVRSVFEKVEALTVNFRAYLKGKKVTCLSIETNPSGATVFVNDVEVGISPLVCYNTVAGKKVITVVKDGYENYEVKITVTEFPRQKIRATLIKQKTVNRFNISAMVHYLYIPDLAQGHEIAASARLGYSLENVTPFLEYTQTFGNLEYSYSFDVPLGQREETRKIMLHNVNTGILFHPFNSGYLSPYFGVIAGYTYLREWDLIEAYYDSETASYSLLSGGGLVGITFIPYSNLRVFMEARYTYNYGLQPRTIVKSVQFGNVNTQEEDIRFSSYMAAIGITIML